MKTFIKENHLSKEDKVQLSIDTISFPYQMYGKNIILKMVHETFFEEITKVFELNKDILIEVFPWMKDFTASENLYKYIVECEKEFLQRKEFNYYIFIDEEDYSQLSEDDFGENDMPKKKLIGQISVFDISYFEKEAQIGFWLSKDYHKKGFMKEALMLIEEITFATGFEKILIKCNGNNNKAISFALNNEYK